MAKNNTATTTPESTETDADLAIQELREQVASLTARLDGLSVPRVAGPMLASIKERVARGNNHIKADEVLALIAELV